MTMKTYISLALMLLTLFLGSCDDLQQKEYKKANRSDGTILVKGHIKNPKKGGKVELFRNEAHKAEYTFINSVRTYDDGNFEFKLKGTPPVYYTIKVYDQKTLIPIVASDYDITIVVDNEITAKKNYEVSGCKDTELLHKFMAGQKKLAVLRKEEPNMPLDEYTQKVKTFAKDFLKEAEAENSITALLGAAMLDTEVPEELEMMENLEANYEERFAKCEYFKRFQQNFKVGKATRKGEFVKDFNVFTPNGDTLKFPQGPKDKYLFVEAWSVSDPNVWKDRKALKAVYEKYQGQLEIISYSYDDTKRKKAWENSINDFPWVHAWVDGTSNFFFGYTVFGFYKGKTPNSYLISPEGKIIGKDLRGLVLGAALEAHQKQKTSKDAS